MTGTVPLVSSVDPSSALLMISDCSSVSFVLDSFHSILLVIFQYFFEHTNEIPLSNKDGSCFSQNSCLGVDNCAGANCYLKTSDVAM